MQTVNSNYIAIIVFDILWTIYCTVRFICEVQFLQTIKYGIEVILLL